MTLRRSLSVFALTATFALLSACSPEVGSKQWCDGLKEKPKDEWTTKEAKAFAEHCLF